MGTRSRIGIEDGETGKVRSIYCHWDGYSDGVGKILLDHYRDRTKVEELIALGDISSLGPEIGEKHDFDWRMELYKEPNSPEFRRLDKMVTAYGRDRGEKAVGSVEDDDAEAMYGRAQEGWEEYAYLYRQGVWFVSAIGGGAGPFLVNADDPNGEGESRWQRVDAVLAGLAEVGRGPFAFAD